MIHLKVLGIKFLAISVVVLSTFGMTNATTIPNLLLISFIMTVVTYLIGDLFILKTTGNIMATISDFGLMFVGLWLLANVSIGTDQPIVPLALTAAFFISFIEPFVHQMLIEQTDNKTVSPRSDWGVQLQTEISEELDPHEQVKEKKENPPQSGDDV